MLFIALLCDIYREGYYIEFNDDYVFDLSELCDLAESRICEIVAYMVELGLFHAGLFDERGVLTSESIQQQYVTIKRKLSVEQLINEDLRLFSPEKPCVSDTKIPQSKGKESKGKESKENILSNKLAACEVEKMIVRHPPHPRGANGRSRGTTTRCRRYSRRAGSGSVHSSTR